MIALLAILGACTLALLILGGWPAALGAYLGGLLIVGIRLGVYAIWKV